MYIKVLLTSNIGGAVLTNHVLEFFFDCSSPWTFLAFEQIQKSCEEISVDICWRPILVGGVFNAVNPSVYEGRANPVPVKSKYYGKDLRDWSEYVGITIGQPAVFPVNSVKAMRGAFVAMDEGIVVAYAREIFTSYWTSLRDISLDEVLREIVMHLGMDPDSYFKKISSQNYKDKLRYNTEELIDRGGFGSPTMFVDETDMYFGNDRIPLVIQSLSR